MNLINQFLQKMKGNKLSIHCIGDAMVDQFISVDVNRISPEAPIMVMHSDSHSSTKRPGGAANVAYQFKHFNVSVKLFCFNDQDALDVFNRHGIECKAGGITPFCSLPIKRRFVHDMTQVARHDIEPSLCGLSSDVIDDITERFKDTVGSPPDVAILSDYNKGFFSSDKFNIMDCYRDVITIVDPKKAPIDKWHGCTIFKPNAKEALDLSGVSCWKKQANFFQSKLGCKSVVITCGGDGLRGIHNGELFSYEPIEKVQVESVIGAGDCFCAFLAMAVGQGYEAPEASIIAWKAGSMYVQHKMNRPVIPAEVVSEKIVDPSYLKSRDFKLVFTNGCFDVLHRGHLKSLQFAKSQGDKLVVALNSDDSVNRLKSTPTDKRPFKSLEERAALLASLDCVDFVVSFEEDDPYELIKEIAPDIMVKSADYKPEDVIGSDLVEVRIAPIFEGVSTTNFLADWREASTDA